jgi:hypothetical protein
MPSCPVNLANAFSNRMENNLSVHSRVKDNSYVGTGKFSQAQKSTYFAGLVNRIRRADRVTSYLAKHAYAIFFLIPGWRSEIHLSLRNALPFPMQNPFNLSKTRGYLESSTNNRQVLWLAMLYLAIIYPVEETENQTREAANHHGVERRVLYYSA